MIERFSQFPASLAERSRRISLDGIPALLAHPDGSTPAPWVLWLHGRTASKELDPGRYLRWLRAGVAAVAVDLPYHGERADPAMQAPERSLDTFEAMMLDMPGVLASLREEHRGLLDPSRAGIGGMSLGGMIALRALCEPHPFKAAVVEATTGWLEGQYFPQEFGLGSAPWPVHHPRERVRRLDAMSRVPAWRPIPLLAVHASGDRVVSWAGQSAFLDALRRRYVESGVDAGLVESLVFEETGAPEEHVGFGRFANDAKNAQAEFLARVL
ncbi:MAG: prolyl oligopeptidase family serine peptidase [Phycisphaeraceae bacterium]|nr:MAG: prolyl oligopeptidase family serine peptidase [Phycisphaeraceae bacterium]